MDDRRRGRDELEIKERQERNSTQRSGTSAAAGFYGGSDFCVYDFRAALLRKRIASGIRYNAGSLVPT